MEEVANNGCKTSLGFLSEMSVEPRVGSNELLTVAVRFKKPDGLFNVSRLLEFPLVDASTAFSRASADFRFAAAVAQYGMILRGSPYRGTASIDDVATWAAAAATADPGGYRGEFVELVRKTQALLE